MYQVIAIALFLLLSAIPSFASSILLSQTGLGTSSWTTDTMHQINAISWTSLSAVNDFSISLKLSGTTTGTRYRAYLTKVLGPAMTVADIVFARTFDVSLPVFTPTWIDVMYGLTLDAGTYYLILDGDGGGWGNTGAGPPALTANSNLTYNGSFYAGRSQFCGAAPSDPLSLQCPFTPLDNVHGGSAPFQFSMSGNLAVPDETSTLLLLIGGFGVLILSRRLVYR